MIASQKMTLSAPKYSIGMSRRNASKVSQRAFVSGIVCGNFINSHY